MAFALSAFVDSPSQLISPHQRKVSMTRKLSNGRTITGRFVSSSRRGSNISLPPIENLPSPLPPTRPMGSQHIQSPLPLTKPLEPHYRLSPFPPTKPRGSQTQPRQRSTIDDDNDTKWMINMTEEDDSPRSLTPEPEVFQDFKIFENGIAVLTEEQKKRSSYRPRYCWCNRCQIMYSMYKKKDPNLEYWGNYPCHQW